MGSTHRLVREPAGRLFNPSGNRLWKPSMGKRGIAAYAFGLGGRNLSNFDPFSVQRRPAVLSIPHPCPCPCPCRIPYSPVIHGQCFPDACAPFDSFLSKPSLFSWPPPLYTFLPPLRPSLTPFTEIVLASSTISTTATSSSSILENAFARTVPGQVEATFSSQAVFRTSQRRPWIGFRRSSELANPTKCLPTHDTILWMATLFDAATG